MHMLASGEVLRPNIISTAERLDHLALYGTIG